MPYFDADSAQLDDAPARPAPDALADFDIATDNSIADVAAEDDRVAEPAEPRVTFADLGIEPELVAILTRQGITSPFPIQEKTLLDGLAGRDICAKAPTGSGKTLAYGLAAVQRTPKCEPRRPHTLILVPTRELARQVADVLVPLAKARRRWVTALYGGASMAIQTDALRKGADIVVATPGRLTDLLERRVLTLSAVSLVVIDEADRMADMGFLPPVRALLDQTNEKRQTLLYSATLDGAVDDLVKNYLDNPIEHDVDSASSPDEIQGVVTHHTVDLGRELPAFAVRAMASAAKRMVVFVNSRVAAEHLTDELDEVGVFATALHGGMTQAARQRSLSQFASGRYPVLVATDVAARGLHVDGIDLVVHADPVFEDKDYVHRSGRTGRAGANGTVVHLVRAKHRQKIDRMYWRLGIKSTAASLASIEDRLRDGTPIEGIERAPDAPSSRPGFNRSAARPGKRERTAGPWRSPGEHRAQGDRPQGDRPQGDRPWSNRPQGDRPQGDRPANNAAYGDRPRYGTSSAARPPSDRPGGNSTFSPDGSRAWAPKARRTERW